MPRDRIRLGFLAAAAYNAGIVLFSRGFSNVLGEVDPHFAPAGCAVILLWGVAYAAVGRSYAAAPAVVAVFCVEKLFYGAYWARWIATHGPELAELRATDPMTAAFFSGYGVGDLAFAAFFGWVAWRSGSAPGPGPA